MIKSSRGGGGGLFNLSFNYIEYSELRGVLEHPEHPLWIRHWVWVKLFH